MLAGDPADLVRRDDEAFAAAGLTAADIADPDGVVRVLLADPSLMQRPVVVRGDRAVIARPAGRVSELLDAVPGDAMANASEQSAPTRGRSATACG